MSNYNSINDIEKKLDANGDVNHHHYHHPNNNNNNNNTLGTTTTTVRSNDSSNFTNNDRFPTLHEVLYRKTISPMDLWSFYCYMRDDQKLIDYLDFWLDSSQHLILCQKYVQGLKSKLIQENMVHTLNRESVISNNDLAIIIPQEQQQHIQQSGYNMTLPTPDLKHKSLSSSILLDMILHDNILDENNSRRLSSFLRGERGLVIDNPEIAEYIETLNRQSMTSEQLLNELNRDSTLEKRISTINPQMLENYIKRSNNSSVASFISRQDITKNAREIFLNYFNKNSLKYLIIPEQLHKKIIYDFEQGHDDPEIFDEIRNFVFRLMENELFPGFLTRFGIMNIPVQIWRLFLSMFLLFTGFWIGYIFIFMNYQRSIRCLVIAPFIMASYLLMSFIYCIDPILCFSNYSYNLNSTKFGLVPIRDPFVKKILVQRSIWVSFLVVLLTACLSVLFIFVPGKRL